MVDMGSVAATWNVRHAREVGGKGAALDLCYLERMGPPALVALVELEGRRLPSGFRHRVSISRSQVRNAMRFDHEAGGWTWRNERRLTRAARIGGKRVLAEGILPSDRDCTGLPPRPVVALPPPPVVDPAPPSPPIGGEVEAIAKADALAQAAEAARAAAKAEPNIEKPATALPRTPLTKAPQR